MPAVSPRRILDAILDAINDNEYTGILLSGLQGHPRKLSISHQDEIVSLWVYVWTLTHGGRPSLPHEYRIQMTTVRSPLALNPSGYTVLIGYEPNLRMFAGFDLQRHSHFTSGSPSVQIDIRELQKALQDGFAFDRKNNQEIAIGFRPDQFMNYVYNAENLHKYGKQITTYNLIAKASSLETITEDDLTSLSQPRKRIVQTVSRMSRSASFREQVCNAYGQRCAVSRMQLKLIEAAHVLPVGAPGSVDNVTNGILLSPTYHRAYDKGLIYLNENFHMKVNTAKESQLRELNLDGGLSDFKQTLGRIHLPSDRRQWPNIRFIRKANRYRGISA